MKLRTQGLSRVVGDRVLFRDLDFEVSSGETLVVQGASGTGKTLLLRAVATLDPLTEGARLTLDGRAPEEWGPTRWRAEVCYVAQRPPAQPRVTARLRRSWSRPSTPSATAGLPIRSRWPRSGAWPRPAGTSPGRSCPAENSSAPRSQWRWPAGRPCSCSTNRPARWIPPPSPRSRPRFASAPRSGSPTTPAQAERVGGRVLEIGP